MEKERKKVPLDLYKPRLNQASAISESRYIDLDSLQTFKKNQPPNAILFDQHIYFTYKTDTLASWKPL